MHCNDSITKTTSEENKKVQVNVHAIFWQHYRNEDNITKRETKAFKYAMTANLNAYNFKLIVEQLF